jgi:predicted GNAT family acetyltransferase
MIDLKTIDVRNNVAKSRYEVTVDGYLSVLDYRLNNNRITFTHAGVPPALEGRGIASKMTEVALNEARANGYEVSALCSFVVSYIERHPEYHALVK